MDLLVRCLVVQFSLPSHETDRQRHRLPREPVSQTRRPKEASSNYTQPHSLTMVEHFYAGVAQERIVSISLPSSSASVPFEPFRDVSVSLDPVPLGIGSLAPGSR